jgi:hypothetical protein
MNAIVRISREENLKGFYRGSYPHSILSACFLVFSNLNLLSLFDLKLVIFFRSERSDDWFLFELEQLFVEVVILKIAIEKRMKIFSILNVSSFLSLVMCYRSFEAMKNLKKKWLRTEELSPFWNLLAGAEAGQSFIQI